MVSSSNIKNNLREFQFNNQEIKFNLAKIPVMSPRTRQLVNDIGGQCFNPPQPSNKVENYDFRAESLENFTNDFYERKLPLCVLAVGVALIALPILLATVNSSAVLAPAILLGSIVIGSIVGLLSAKSLIKEEEKELRDSKEEVEDYVELFYMNFLANGEKLKTTLDKEISNLIPRLQNSNFNEADGRRYNELKRALYEVKRLLEACNDIRNSLNPSAQPATYVPAPEAYSYYPNLNKA